MEDVCVSGAVWSSLVLEHANSKGDSEGFLIGDVSGREVNSISDSSSQHLKYERISKSLYAVFIFYSFYDKVGRIDRQKFQDTVGQCQEVSTSTRSINTVEGSLGSRNSSLSVMLKNIIGWYKFRRNSQQLVSMRERHVHHNLIKELRFSPQEFLFIVFTASIEAGLSVHSLNYSIYSSTSLNREDFIDRDGCMQQPLSTHSMYISLVRNMKDILIDVKNSESTVSVMSEQVDSLREQVETLKNKLLVEEGKYHYLERKRKMRLKREEELKARLERLDEEDRPTGCVLCPKRIDIEINYKNIRLLSQFVSPHTGRIYGRQATGLCEKRRRQITNAIKRSRAMGKYWTLSTVSRQTLCPKLFY
ncbi:hypothetical protein QZH41_019514 [Actinostola sp. cb2023]|nr:hypothetical protein QZH41_019514 [Actinostola sp. cb2023]